MDKKWEDLQKQLQEEAKIEKQEIPDSLQPENIELLLKKKNRRWKPAYMSLAAAACVCLIIGGIVGGRFLVKNVVDKADDGLSDQKYVSSSNSKTLDADKPEEGLVAAADYDEIYQYLKRKESSNRFGEDIATYATDGAMNKEETADASQVEMSHSDTNVREEGVGEADTVKTDGNYIYTLKDGMYIDIVDIRDHSMSISDTIDMSKEGQVIEFYIQNEKLYICYTNNEMNTCVKTFDISNPAEPKEEGIVTQSGDYYTMRVVDNYIYLISQLYVYDINGSVNNPSLYIPLVQDKELTADSIYMPTIEYGKQYTIISSINMNQPNEVVDSKALLSSTGMCYVSDHSIYLCDQIYSDTEAYNQTAIRKIDYQDGSLTAVGQTKVWGILNDSFSIDEYQGNLRMVTTVTPKSRYNYGISPLTSLRDFVPEDSLETSDSATQEPSSDTESADMNALYILDANLNQISKLEKIAEGEQIYSARFIGDTAYFVTYKQVDPLFSVDLTDPKSPVILGELKIPGFSEYLHLYRENLLLGIGMDVEEDGMTTNGVKLSMFDITDPVSVSEKNKEVLPNVYGSDAFYDYKSVLIDADKNLIGFAAYSDRQHYYVYSYDDKNGFTCEFDRELDTDWYGTPRGLYVGERFYLVEANAIESYDLATFDKIDDIVL